MLDIYKTENLKLQYVATHIHRGMTSGIDPFWQLSFGEYYRSWHLSDANKELIAHCVLLENKEGFIMEIVDGESVQIHWKIEIEQDDVEEQA
jgi:hypothetical protein